MVVDLPSCEKHETQLLAVVLMARPNDVNNGNNASTLATFLWEVINASPREPPESPQRAAREKIQYQPTVECQRRRLWHKSLARLWEVINTALG